MFPILLYFWEIIRIQTLSYISLKIFPLWNYRLFPATVKMLETFLKAILWNPFHLYPHIRNDVSSNTKPRTFRDNISRRNRSKSAVAKSEVFEGCFSFVTLFLSKKSLTKTGWCAGALSWMRNQLLVLNFSGRFSVIASLRRRRISVYISLFTVLRIPWCSNCCKLYQRIPGSFWSYYIGAS